MSLPEMSAGVLREFAEIVENHTEPHQKDRRDKIIAAIVLSGMSCLMINSHPVMVPLVVLALMIWGARVWLSKPDLSKHISPEEIETLSDSARSAFHRLVRTWNRGVSLSDLDSVVRTASQKHRAMIKVRQQAESSRRAREQQERALYARRQKKDDSSSSEN